MGKSWTLILRRNQQDTPLFVTIADNNVEGSATGSVTIAPGDRFSFIAYAAGTPSSVTARSWVSLLVDNTILTPSITAVAPASGQAGQAVTITGTDFGATQGTSTVTFNGTVATVTSWSDTSISVLVPGGAPSGPVVVNVNGTVASNGVTFTGSPTPGPRVQYMYDEAGRLAGVVDPNGDAAAYRYDAAGNLTMIGRTTANQVSIVEFNPNKGPAGSSVTIYGTGFSTTLAQNTVQFNGVVATVTDATANRLIVTVPPDATSGTITVSSPLGQAVSSDAFVVTVTEDPLTAPDTDGPTETTLAAENTPSQLRVPAAYGARLPPRWVFMPARLLASSRNSYD
jgi:YD repeat-containing protein